jgi:hypothetical protein
MRRLNLWLDHLPVLAFMALNGALGFAVVAGTSAMDHLRYGYSGPILIEPAIWAGLSWALVSALAREVRRRRERERTDRAQLR